MSIIWFLILDCTRNLIIKVFNSICTGRVGLGARYRPISVFSISFLFSICSMTMILCVFSLKTYGTHFGEIWWYLVWTQSCCPWLNTHFKNKCNLWLNSHEMEITLFLLQFMIIGTKFCFNIHSNNTDLMTY